jgi:hypothetical protein
MKYEPQISIEDENREIAFTELKKQAVTMILAISEDAQVPDLASVVISSISPHLYIDVCNFCIEVFVRDEEE